MVFHALKKLICLSYAWPSYCRRILHLTLSAMFIFTGFRNVGVDTYTCGPSKLANWLLIGYFFFSTHLVIWLWLFYFWQSNHIATDYVDNIQLFSCTLWAMVWQWYPLSYFTPHGNPNPNLDWRIKDQCL